MLHLENWKHDHELNLRITGKHPEWQINSALVDA